MVSAVCTQSRISWARESSSADVVAVVGGDQRDVELFFHPEQASRDVLVGLQAVVLDFEEEVPFAEDFLSGRRFSWPLRTSRP